MTTSPTMEEKEGVVCADGAWVIVGSKKDQGHQISGVWDTLAGDIEEVNPSGGLKPVDGLMVLTSESRSTVPEEAANAIRWRAILRVDAGRLR
ncbi:hypothetical protein M0R45_008038 [Rubus argutus]|uniref:Uncharacterized protein n=1 Tax=Rubus argutus TaxID=59490 RepID=A0AAW1Y0D6_RUBAR